MKKALSPSSVREEEIRALLDRYACPLPFHQVRTRFLGSIAAPGMTVSPMQVVQGLWGGEMPEFETLDAANELIGALVMGLWNQLTRHQQRSSPFRLMRPVTAPTREGLAALGLMRRQELDGFIEGLFGVEDEAEFPERAHRALGAIGEMGALFAGVADVAADVTKSGNQADIEATLRLVRDMTKIAEHEMHALVLACTRSRRQVLAGFPAKKPTLH